MKTFSSRHKQSDSSDSDLINANCDVPRKKHEPKKVKFDEF